MKVKVHATKAVKPSYGEEKAPPATTDVVPLSVFDKVNFDTYVSVLYAFRPPAPPNSVLEEGLSRALAEYREWAGRFGQDEDGSRAIVLNDAGARLVEATAETTLASAMPFKPTPALLSLHPRGEGAEELLLVQFTRFACGSLVLGFTAHHLVSDGRATSNFLLAWGQASRAVPVTPTPVHDRVSFFQPRDPPRFDFEHCGAEFMRAKKNDNHVVANPLKEEVVVHKVHFTKDFLTKLKSRASVGADLSYSTFQCLVAHLWRALTRARALNGCETTSVRIAVDGRARMVPNVPEGYTGNVVLWAVPRANVWELVTRPLQHAVELIHREVHRVNDAYFKSFIDFAHSDVVEKEGLVSCSDASEMVLCPDLEVDSWLRLPFYNLDFGGGSPYFFMPTYLPVEGLLILLPSFFGDGSIDAYVPLYRHNVDAFKSRCYSLD